MGTWSNKSLKSGVANPQSFLAKFHKLEVFPLNVKNVGFSHFYGRAKKSTGQQHQWRLPNLAFSTSLGDLREILIRKQLWAGAHDSGCARSELTLVCLKLLWVDSSGCFSFVVIKFWAGRTVGPCVPCFNRKDCCIGFNIRSCGRPLAIPTWNLLRFFVDIGQGNSRLKFVLRHKHLLSQLQPKGLILGPKQVLMASFRSAVVSEWLTRPRGNLCGLASLSPVVTLSNSFTFSVDNCLCLSRAVSSYWPFDARRVWMRPKLFLLQFSVCEPRQPPLTDERHFVGIHRDHGIPFSCICKVRKIYYLGLHWTDPSQDSKEQIGRIYCLGRKNLIWESRLFVRAQGISFPVIILLRAQFDRRLFQVDMFQLVVSPSSNRRIIALCLMLVIRTPCQQLLTRLGSAKRGKTKYRRILHTKQAEALSSYQSWRLTRAQSKTFGLRLALAGRFYGFHSPQALQRHLLIIAPEISPPPRCSTVSTRLPVVPSQYSVLFCFVIPSPLTHFVLIDFIISSLALRGLAGLARIPSREPVGRRSNYFF